MAEHGCPRAFWHPVAWRLLLGPEDGLVVADRAVRPSRPRHDSGETSPTRIANRTRPVRSWTPRRSMICPRCDSTVFTERSRSAAISFDDFPSATSCRISRCRVVKPASGIGLRGSGLDVALDDLRRDLRAEVDLAARHGLDRHRQLVVGGVLQEVARDPGAQRLRDVRLAGVHRQDQHLRPGRDLRRAHRHLEPVQARHRDVEDGEVGAVLLDAAPAPRGRPPPRRRSRCRGARRARHGSPSA